MSALDFNTAETQSELIPDGTTAHVRISVVVGDGKNPPRADALIKASKSESLMLTLEAVVTEGKFARRRFWPRYFMGLDSGKLTEGQETAVGISRKMIRAIVEAARGIGPTDETPAAMKQRVLTSYEDLDGMEFWCVIGIEKGRDGFDDKNVIKRVLPAGKEPAEADLKREATATKAAAGKAAQKGW
jgi:hypothetical protein